ncbi:uncharacterized protein LOC134441247 [Engraulis encrasicolus]|uniref:uncharacterized protein LOC134441247 n=1 Tax=Engraulis encrasicolus TaxID=184585 RepID=UPI002FD748E7
MAGYYPNRRGRGGNSGQQHHMRNSGQQQHPGLGYYEQLAVGNSGQEQRDDMKGTGHIIHQQVNERGIEESHVCGVHMTVGQLMDECFCFEKNQYIGKQVAAANEMTEDKEIVPHYPRPVEFHVSHIAHVTTEEGMNTVMSLMGFIGKSSAIVWWDLAIGPEEVGGAEQRYLDKVFPDRTEEEKRRKMPFLRKFTTSPVFKDGSRYGNFRFTLPLKEVLEAYRSQFCGEKEPILRVWQTVVYKQEIMYSVMVHCPDVHCYDNFPILGDNEEGMCAYRNGEIIWRAQAISETHEFRLKTRHDRRQVSAQRVNEKVFYVWDHVALAFHVPSEDGLSFPRQKLVDCLTACPDGDMALNELIGYEKAKKAVDDWIELQEMLEQLDDLEGMSMGERVAMGKYFPLSIIG